MKLSRLCPGVALSFLLPGIAAFADAAGYWTGEISSGEAVTPIAVRLSSEGTDGRSTIGFPRSGIREASLSDVAMDGNSVQFSFSYRRITYGYDGKVDGDSLTGTVSFDEKTLPFTLSRTEWNPPYTTEDFAYTNGDISLASTLYLPKGPGPHPALMMMHGSGDNSRGRYAYWGDFFARRGVALLTSDKRGCGDSGGDWNTVGFEALARDGLAGVEWLRKRDDIDPSRIGMTGISQAGWVMVQAAALSDDLAFLLVDSGATYDVEREGYFDYEAALEAGGHSQADIEEALVLLRMDNAVTRTGEGYDELRAAWKVAREKDWYKSFRFFPLPADAKFRNFYRLILDFDPRPLLENIDLPILWLYGADDMSVAAAECIPILEDIRQRGDKDYTIHLFPNADHGLRVAPDPAKDAIPFPVFADGYLEAKSDYVRVRIHGLE